MARHHFSWVLFALACGGLVVFGGGLACRSDKTEPITTTAASAAPARGDVTPPANAAPASPERNAACARAEACCRAMVKKLPTAQQNFAPCGDVHKMDQSNCVPMYEKYRQAAQALGVTCD